MLKLASGCVRLVMFELELFFKPPWFKVNEIYISEIYFTTRNKLVNLWFSGNGLQLSILLILKQQL